ncbi:hypothetical protein [Agromyces cerinus]|uniref:Uncharacterized protein n=1 Tax=Agromyces cerinus subsp. cerinus TaxID=232089 RepID=A0A1N6HPG2_9MICO|nr:hypothetical protein [Agromyces cerinus]SIO21606.1 hypothetical protein SAMN05443544_3373 [Agromyces cerinus subsp. cerinus]
MNDDNDLDPVARLRGADPAAGVEPRPGFADEVIARATAETADGGIAATAAAPGEPAEIVDLESERDRRRPRWLVVAAVAASVAIVGGAGFGIGTMTAGSTELAAAPISLQMGDAQGGSADGAPQQESAAFDAAGRKMAGSSANDMMMPYGYGRNTFSATGLSTAGGTAAAYAYDARAASNTETVAALAAALGIEGTPELKDGSWTVGPQDGSGPALYVGLDGTLGFSYSDPRNNPWACEPMMVEPAAPDGAVIPEMPTCEPPVADLPSEAAAIDALRSLITAAGRDADAFEYTSETWEGAVTRTAQAWPVVDGQRIDQAWSLELTKAGIVSASGALADLVTIGDYDVVSEQEGFERLSDMRFGAQVTAMRFDAADAPVDSPVEEWVPPTEPPATPAEGSSVSWPVNDVQIVSARLGLSSQWQPDGSVLVVPAYEFTDADGGTWSVIAVTESKLDFATE